MCLDCRAQTLNPQPWVEAARYLPSPAMALFVTPRMLTPPHTTHRAHDCNRRMDAVPKPHGCAPCEALNPDLHTTCRVSIWYPRMDAESERVKKEQEAVEDALQGAVVGPDGYTSARQVQVRWHWQSACDFRG